MSYAQPFANMTTGLIGPALSQCVEYVDLLRRRSLELPLKQAMASVALRPIIYL